MESVLTPSEKNKLVSSFLEVAIGQTAETATQFLQATSWKLEEAIQLFYIGNEGGGVTSSSGFSSLADKGPSPTEDVVASENAGGQVAGDEEVRPPLPVKREVLYDDASFYRLNPSSVVAFRNFDEESKRPGVWDTDQNIEPITNSSRDNLASLYRPPFALMHHGPFEKAKVEASLQDKWLLVNLQSTDEFSSHMLNRDTWSNEAVAQTIRTNFFFWQVYRDSSEGKKVCTYYKLVSMPAVLVIDPTTGQKMCAWNGMIRPERLLENLLPFMDRGPKEHHVLHRKRQRESTETSIHNAPDKTPEEDNEEVPCSGTASVEDGNDVVGSIAANSEAPKRTKTEEDTITTNEQQPIYPPLPEEPQGDKKLLCKVGIRLPDGQRLQRNFFRTDPVQLLWSFCHTQLGDGEARLFRFTQAIPGAATSLAYDSKLTFGESGLSNSMVTLTWE